MQDCITLVQVLELLCDFCIVLRDDHQFQSRGELLKEFTVWASQRDFSPVCVSLEHGKFSLQTFL